MRNDIIALSQKNLHLLGVNLGAVRLGYNCYLYEIDVHTHANLCEALGYDPSVVKWSKCYLVAYSCGEYGNSAQLHRVELELVNGQHMTRFVYYTSIKYKE